MFKDKNKIKNFFNTHRNYYSFYNYEDSKSERENKGCFGLLKYDKKYYFALSGALESMVKASRHYGDREKVINEIKRISHYEYAPLRKNAITFYLKFKFPEAGKDARKENEDFLVLKNYSKKYLTLEECCNEESSSKSIEDYLEKNHNLFDCVERMLIANAEDEFSDFEESKHVIFIIKWKPCVKCIDAVNGKKVLFYFENFDDFKRNYDAGNLKLKKFK